MYSAAGVPLWRRFLEAASTTIRAVYACLSPLGLSFTMALALAAAAAGLLAINAWAFVTLARPRVAGVE